jgi:hypothetical protein
MASIYSLLSNQIGLSINCLLTLLFTYRVWYMIKTNSDMITGRLKFFLLAYNAMLVIISIGGFIEGDIKRYILSAAKTYFMLVYFFLIYQMKKL